MSAPILEINRLTVDYQIAAGRLRAVNDVTFSLNRGEILGVVGESGSGKSTLVLAILDLLERPGLITHGSVKYQGEMLQARDAAFWGTVRGRGVGMIFQSPQSSFNPCATIGNQLERIMCTHFPVSRTEARTRIVDALERVKMPRSSSVLDSYAFELSGGMCQRVALAAALMLEPKLLIADEPTSSLDLVTQVEITRLLEEIHLDSALSMILVSHDIGFVSSLASHVAVMHRGKLVEHDSLENILYAPRDPYTRALLNSIPRLIRTARPESGGKTNAYAHHRHNATP